MNGNKLFLDTNIVLYFLNGDKTLGKLLNGKQLFISVITELELLAFKNITIDEEKIITAFIKDCKVISLNNPIKKETVRIRKFYSTKLPDSIIIASAIYLDLPLITADKEFEKIEELSLISYEH